MIARAPDIEMALLDWVKTIDPALADEDGMVDTHVGNDTPGPSLDQRLPFVVIERVGGPDTLHTDYPVISVDVFGRNRMEAYDVAESIRTGLLTPLLFAGGVVIDSATTRTFAKAPWGNPAVFRWGATYELSVRRR